VAQAAGAEAGPWILWVGIILICVPLIYVFVLALLSYPPILSPDQIIGRKLTLTELKSLTPDCVKIALIGVGFVGKTTLLEYLTALDQTNAETKSPEMVIFQVAPPVRTLVYLDAAGEDLTQQFEIMDHADLLVLLLDHNKPEGGITISDDRMIKQGHNVDQLVRKIRRLEREGNPVLAIHVLRNKQDMWSQSSTVEIQKLLAWFTQQLEKVRDVMPEDTVSDADHSNELTGDIAAVRAKLMQLAQRVVQQRQPH
jgi:hypothetical protein